MPVQNAEIAAMFDQTADLSAANVYEISYTLGGIIIGTFFAAELIGAPIFGRLAERRSRWMLVGVGVILWSLASGASGLAGQLARLDDELFVANTGGEALCFHDNNEPPRTSESVARART